MGSTYCTETCDWCNKWTEDWTEMKSANDGSGYCSFQGVVTTHNEPMDDYVPEYNHTVTVEADGTETEMWIEEPQNFSTYEDTSYTEVVDPWCPSSMSSVQYCDECGATTDIYYNWVGSSMTEGSVDIYGMEMTFSEPDPAMYNYSNMHP